MEWYRWNSLETAQACLNVINGDTRLPLTGNNSKTGEMALDDKCKTTKWCESVVECTDGKFGFPRVTQVWLDLLGVTAEESAIFLATFNPDVEAFDSAWIPSRDEEL
jgi:hypothetical protein